MFIRTEEECITITLPFPTLDYDQTPLIEKVNLYLKKYHQPLWNPAGMCHGLTIVWQRHMGDGTEQDFYALKRKIIHYPKYKIDEMHEDAEIQEFIKQVQTAQDPQKYSTTLVRQIDVDKILQTSPQLYFRDWISIRSFAEILRKYSVSYSSITASSWDSFHSMGIYFRDYQFHVFDPNYKSGEAKKFHTALEAGREMTECLYISFGKNCPQWISNMCVMMNNLSSRKNIASNYSPGFFSSNPKMLPALNTKPSLLSQVYSR